jgi:hypothetical protein
VRVPTVPLLSASSQSTASHKKCDFFTVFADADHQCRGGFLCIVMRFFSMLM